MSAIIAAGVTILVALFFTHWFYSLPEAALGAIVIVAVSGMVKIGKLRRLSRVRREDFILAVVALLAVLTFETLEALLIAVIASLFALVLRASQPRLAILGRVPDRLEFTDVRRYPENKTVPGLLMARPLNGLYFANAAGFREAVITEMLASSEPIKAVMLDLSATTDLDVPSANMLAELSEELHNRSVRLMLIHVITPVRQMLARTGAIEKINQQDIFAEPVEAVMNYLLAECDAAGIEDLLRSGANEMHNLLQASLASVPVENQAAIVGLIDSLDNQLRRKGSSE